MTNVGDEGDNNGADGGLDSDNGGNGGDRDNNVKNAMADKLIPI